jgi:hypothetical protein
MLTGRQPYARRSGDKLDTDHSVSKRTMSTLIPSALAQTRTDKTKRCRHESRS